MRISRQHAASSRETDFPRVVTIARNPEAFELARQKLGDRLLYIISDAGDVFGQKKVDQKVKEDFGNLDVLIVNGGVNELQPR